MLYALALQNVPIAYSVSSGHLKTGISSYGMGLGHLMTFVIICFHCHYYLAPNGYNLCCLEEECIHVYFVRPCQRWIF